MTPYVFFLPLLCPPPMLLHSGLGLSSDTCVIPLLLCLAADPVFLGLSYGSRTGPQPLCSSPSTERDYIPEDGTSQSGADISHSLCPRPQPQYAKRPPLDASRGRPGSQCRYLARNRTWSASTRRCHRSRVRFAQTNRRRFDAQLASPSAHALDRLRRRMYFMPLRLWLAETQTSTTTFI